MSYRSSSTYNLGLPGFTRAVKWLMIVTAGVWVLQVLMQAIVPETYGQLALLLMLTPARLLHGAFWQPFTYLFLHATFWHLLWNMLGLWFFGVAVEGALGAARFLRFYFFCGVGAGLIDVALHLLLGRSLDIPTLGASGAIYGVLLAFGMMFPDQPVFLLLPPVTLKAKWLVLIYGGLEFLFAIAGSFGQADNVSHFAHLGGMLFAYIFIQSRRPRGRFQEAYRRWRRRRLQRRFEVYMSKRDRHDDRGDRWVN